MQQFWREFFPPGRVLGCWIRHGFGQPVRTETVLFVVADHDPSFLRRRMKVALARGTDLPGRDRARSWNLKSRFSQARPAFGTGKAAVATPINRCSGRGAAVGTFHVQVPRFMRVATAWLPTCQLRDGARAPRTQRSEERNSGKAAVEEFRSDRDRGSLPATLRFGQLGASRVVSHPQCEEFCSLAAAASSLPGQDTPIGDQLNVTARFAPRKPPVQANLACLGAWTQTTLSRTRARRGISSQESGARCVSEHLTSGKEAMPLPSPSLPPSRT